MSGMVCVILSHKGAYVWHVLYSPLHDVYKLRTPDLHELTNALNVDELDIIAGFFLSRTHASQTSAQSATQTRTVAV